MYYLTTPIYYVNDLPHIGHAYTTLSADVLARYKKIKGEKVFFLTGTDEHGKKIEKAAEERGISPQELADEVHKRFKELWSKLKIEYTKFIRTTDKEHIEAVKYFWKKIEKDVYKGRYRGMYCVSCENFLSPSEVDGGRCPVCKREVDILEEETHFFRVERYKRILKEEIEKGTMKIFPEFRKNEVLNAIDSIGDISISRPRSRVSWGIEVPGDEDFTIYVWVDALCNYLSGTGYPKDFIWPADLHLIGKDILKFHAILWPMFLMSAGLELPRVIFAHGWWKVKGEKMSKSLRNIVDPNEIVSVFGVCGFRYFLFREMPFGYDGDFSEEAIKRRYTDELLKDIGNLVVRVTNLAEKYGRVEKTFINLNEIDEIRKNWERYMEEIKFFDAINQILKLASSTNKLVDEKAPWELIKSGRRMEANEVLYNLLYRIKVIAVMISPFCPDIGGIIIQTLKDKIDFELPEIFEVSKSPILFPKI